MAKTSQLVGVILMVLGGGGYVMSGMASPTALIPAFFGIVISGLGYYGRHEHTRKTAMHLAMGIALVGILGSARGLMGLPAVSVSFVLPLLCFVFIAFYGYRTLRIHEQRGIKEAL